MHTCTVAGLTLALWQPCHPIGERNAVSNASISFNTHPGYLWCNKTVTSSVNVKSLNSMASHIFWLLQYDKLVLIHAPHLLEYLKCTGGLVLANSYCSFCTQDHVLSILVMPPSHIRLKIKLKWSVCVCVCVRGGRGGGGGGSHTYQISELVRESLLKKLNPN